MSGKKVNAENHGIIRVELNHMLPMSKRVLLDTIARFRDITSYLVHVVCDHKDDILPLNSMEALTAVERLVHHTKQNPTPEYAQFDLLFNRFPSYLRRAAIHAAVGHVSSHETRCDQYYERRDVIVARGHHYKKMEPRFTYTPSVCPTLYDHSSFTRHGREIYIKVYTRNTWVWMPFSMPNRDFKNLKKASDKGKLKNPKLVYDYSKFYLEFPVVYANKPMPDMPLNERVVLSVDRGFNHGAVVSVVNASGTVLKRCFDPFTADMARIDHLINLIRKAGRESGRGQSLASLYTKLEGLKSNYVKQLSRWIVNLAIENKVYGIVLEHLESIRGKGRGRLKARIQHWTTARMRDYIKGMALRAGIRTFIVNPKGTSKYAFDGSGEVSRDADNYAMCTFTNGKRYNCDLSASYNIAARYFLRELQKSMSETAWSQLKAKVPELGKRTEWTLHTLRIAQSVLCA